MGADPHDLAAVRSFASEFGLAIVKEDPAARTIQVTGLTARIADAFAVDLVLFSDGRNHY